MFALGAARDAGLFNAAVERNSKPSPNSITYGGVFNENLFKCSTTDLILEPFTHSAVDRNGELYLGVEVVSMYDGKPRIEDTTLDLVIVIDISGSMGSSFGKSSKLQAAKDFTTSVCKKLWKGKDEVAIIMFDNTAEMVLDPVPVGDNVDAIEAAVSCLKTRGGTTVESGLELGIQTALKMRESKKDRKNHFSRLLLLTDMRDGEVRSAEKKIVELTLKAAKDSIYTSYVGIGEDFNDQLTEKITISNASNYFCVKDMSDFETRISNEMFSAFFPTVKDMEMEIITKQHAVLDLFGAGKEIKYSKEGEGWTRDNESLYGEQTKEVVDKLRSGGMNSDVIGLIMKEVGEDKPITVLKEKSVFPSPSNDTPDQMSGGFILVHLKRLEGGDGIVRIRVKFTNLDGSSGKIEKDIMLSEAEEAVKNKTSFCSGEGMKKAMVLKQYVDYCKQLLSKPYVRDSEKDFLEWFEQQEFPLKQEKENVEKIVKLLREALDKEEEEKKDEKKEQEN